MYQTKDEKVMKPIIFSLLVELGKKLIECIFALEYQKKKVKKKMKSFAEKHNVKRKD